MENISRGNSISKLLGSIKIFPLSIRKLPNEIEMI